MYERVPDQPWEQYNVKEVENSVGALNKFVQSLYFKKKVNSSSRTTECLHDLRALPGCWRS